MEDYQERVVEEKKELDFKIEKLEGYILKNVTNTFDILNEQLVVMHSYSRILRERIGDF